MNRRSDLRIQYLLDAYRALADMSHRKPDPGSANVKIFEQGLADIQLLGSKTQAELAVAVGKELAENGEANLDELLLSLRDSS